MSTAISPAMQAVVDAITAARGKAKREMEFLKKAAKELLRGGADSVSRAVGKHPAERMEVPIDGNIHAINNLVDKIRRLDEALERAQAGTLDICQNPDCQQDDQKIPLRRLIVRDFAVDMCTPCKAEIEKTEKKEVGGKGRWTSTQRPLDCCGGKRPRR